VTGGSWAMSNTNVDLADVKEAQDAFAELVEVLNTIDLSESNEQDISTVNQFFERLAALYGG
jgi:hypothetical protein